MVKADVASGALSSKEVLILIWNGLPPLKAHALAYAKD